MKKNMNEWKTNKHEWKINKHDGNKQMKINKHE